MRLEYTIHNDDNTPIVEMYGYLASGKEGYYVDLDYAVVLSDDGSEHSVTSIEDLKQYISESHIMHALSCMYDGIDWFEVAQDEANATADEFDLF